MKKTITTLLFLALSWSALGLDKTELEHKAQKLLAKFESLQEKPDKRVPAELLRKARGIILLNRTKAGLVFAYQGGGGVAMVRGKNDQWSPLAFMKANEGSLGFQIGGQQTFLVVLLMNEQSAKTLVADATFEFGGEARGTAGDNSSGVEEKVEDVQRSVLVYEDLQGLFGGAAIKGGATSPDQEANRVYYGVSVTMQEILFDKKFVPTQAASALARKIEQYAKAGG
jgi:lipid-binding SYLF domain-containing protein